MFKYEDHKISELLYIEISYNCILFLNKPNKNFYVVSIDNKIKYSYKKKLFAACLII